ncbi:MAG: hypothetical protein WCF07_14820, partial [Nitrososphaeraceae archaeon]
MLVLSKDKVNTFLDSIGRSSKNTKHAYATGLTHFTEFLKSKSSNNKQTPDIIISQLKSGKSDVYELLDQFVSYLLSLATQNISPRTLDSYITAVRSFLMYFDIDIVPYKFKRRVKVPKFYPDPEQALSLSDLRALLE